MTQVEQGEDICPLFECSDLLMYPVRRSRSQQRSEYQYHPVPVQYQQIQLVPRVLPCIRLEHHMKMHCPWEKAHNSHPKIIGSLGLVAQGGRYLNFECVRSIEVRLINDIQSYIPPANQGLQTQRIISHHQCGQMFLLAQSENWY